MLGLFLALAVQLTAQEAAPPAGRRIGILLVSDFATRRLVSSLEEFRPVTKTEFGPTGSTTTTLGEDSVLWVRSAHVDQKFFFEKYHQGKYIGRDSKVEVEAKELGVGTHVIQPGNHQFALDAAGKLSSTDPNIRIDGDTVMLQLHKVTVYGVDGTKTGPPDFRKLPVILGILTLAPEARLDPAKLPDPRELADPRTPPAAGKAAPPLTNVLSHQKQFYPLSVWLPANQVGQGYLLYPSWQAFHLTPDGKVQLAAGQAPAVPGITAEGLTIVVPYRQFSGAVNSNTGLQGGVGSETLASEMNFSATLEPLRFRAGLGTPPPEFFLPVDQDLTRNPYRSFLADNTGADPTAVRLVAMDWGHPVFVRGTEGTLSLRLLETPGKETLAGAEVRMAYAVYDPALPKSRDWREVKVLSWANGRDQGPLRFTVPDLEFAFVCFRAQLFPKGDRHTTAPLSMQLLACVIDRGQVGTASWATNRGRTAFVAGEDIRVTLVLRSQAARPAGPRTVVLTHPDGQTETLPVTDPGDQWSARGVVLPAAATSNLLPGRYTLSVKELPPGIVGLPYHFDVVSRQPSSPFLVIKPSKYTGPMNNLETSHLNPQGNPEDLDRAMRTLAELGYNRVDLMTYITNHHARGYVWREEMAGTDERLPAPESVYTPTPREQILDGCVRYGLQYADVWLTYNDFHLPRYIEGYINASERWFARETQAMRYSPGFDGMILYDEMYQMAATGLVEAHAKLFPKIRATVLADTMGKTPAKIEGAMNKYLERPRAQRDPQVLQDYLAYKDWQQHGWGDYVTRIVKVGKELAPQARFGTYTRTWLAPGSNDDIYNGYPPDLFKNLDFISHVHYADNSTCWVSIPLLAQALRTGTNKPLYINLPLAHEGRTEWDGQYQRHMAFALLAQGANGIAHWGLPHSFEDGANFGTLQGRETTRHLNREILQPFGDLVNHTRDAYRRVGIVSTLNQHAVSEFKPIAVANQTEGIWIACWRLGYPAVFLREDDFREPLRGFDVVFVPGVRFDGELADGVMRGLKELIAAGTKVVVERGSLLDLPGLVKLDDWALNEYFVGTYFPTWLDDELVKTYQKSQPIVDYLRPKFREWGVEPAATGPFTVGPSWRQGGAIQYLIMANFEDPPYNYTVRQQMAKPVRMPLRFAPTRGAVAYDLLAGKELPLEKVKGDRERTELALTLDMTRVQGALVALTTEPVGKLRIRQAVSPDPARLRLGGTLVGASGKALDAVFPARITLRQGAHSQVYFRTLGQDLAAELDLPRAAAPWQVEVRELITGQTVTFTAASAAPARPSLQAADERPYVPYPGEVKQFLARTKKVVVVPAATIPGSADVARDLAQRLTAKGLAARLAEPDTVYHFPSGAPEAEDPLMDGFHSWRHGQEIIGPPMVVDEDVILLGGRHSSFLADALLIYGYISSLGVGQPGQPAPPSIQLARKALHFKYDTLCLLANDRAGLERCVTLLLGELPAPAALAAPGYGAEATVESAGATASTPALAYMGTNELVNNLAFDGAGNVYATTWGHGKNLYSFTPDGKVRFSRYLPEMGTNRLEVFADHLLAYTAAGARVYRLGLDGQPQWQVRLNQDPGPTGSDDQYSLSWSSYGYAPGRKLLLHIDGGIMRVLDEQFNQVATWHGETYQDKDVADKVFTRVLGGYALSPDGQRLAQIETSFYYTRWGHEDVTVYDAHLVIRDFDGKLLFEHKNLENGGKLSVNVSWPDGAPGPMVTTRDECRRFDGELKELSRTRFSPGAFGLGGLRRLLRDGRTLIYYPDLEQEQCRIGPFTIMPTLAALSPDGNTLAFVDEYGLVSVFGAADGRQVATFSVPEMPRLVRFTPDSKALVFGGARGGITRCDLTGKVAWQARLGDYNDVLGQDLPLVDPSFRDFTEKLWPVSRDQPGELDGLVRMGANRLVNGDAEGNGGWTGAVQYRQPGYSSGRCLGVGADPVSQDLTEYLGKHVSWVLEFFYKRAAAGAAPVELTAGVLSTCAYPDAVARTFRPDDTWRFARVAVKSGLNCEKLTVGFSASGGEVLVDQAQCRQMRFPSINYLLYDPLYKVKPVLLDNPLLAEKYDPFGNAREETPNRILIEPIKTGALNLIEAAFLQNGRLNDTAGDWYIQPLGKDPVVSLGLKEPRWISLVALYFNVYDERNVTPHFDIYATDMETKTDRLVASVRHNAQVFRLVKFAPVKTPLLKIQFINSISRLRPLTEIEIYGPLSGREGAPGFLDPDGQNTWMGDFSRVDKRAKSLPPKYLPPIGRGICYDEAYTWYPPMTQMLVASQRVHFGCAFGKNSAVTFDDFTKKDFSRVPLGDFLYWGRAGGMGYTPYGALYGGLILRPGVDGKLYCLNPEAGTELWSVKLGLRLFGCPVAIGEDVYAANETGQLFQIDLANGSVMKQVTLGGGVFGALATDGTDLFAITADGFLQCVRAANLTPRWKAPVAPDTDSTPAVDQGVVYIADQKGLAQAIDVANGAVRWKAELGDEFSRCPVVGTDKVLYGCRGGTLAAVVRASGAAAWKFDAKSRFCYEPLILGDKALYFRGGAGMLANLSDGQSAPLTWFGQAQGQPAPQENPFGMEEPLFPVSYYQQHLFLVPRHGDWGHGDFHTNYPWHVGGGTFLILRPTPPPAPPAPPPAK